MPSAPTSRAALLATIVLLAGLAGTVGLSPLGWLTGIACAVATSALVEHASAGRPLGPADRVTLGRAVLVAAVAALVVDGYVRHVALSALVALAVLALVLDAVDGEIARITGTQSRFGARFDLEVDALLILVLSVHVARTIGPWVLAIGAARYVLLGAAQLAPWLRVAAAPRYWRKVVAAAQGVVLTVAAADVLPLPVIEAALATALVLLAESFGHEVWWLRRRRRLATRPPAAECAVGLNSSPRLPINRSWRGVTRAG